MPHRLLAVGAVFRIGRCGQSSLAVHLRVSAYNFQKLMMVFPSVLPAQAQKDGHFAFRCLQVVWFLLWRKFGYWIIARI